MIYVIGFIIIVYAGMWMARRTTPEVIDKLVCLLMICVAGLRKGYIDTRAYRQGFINANISEVLSTDFIFYSEAKDRGFSILTAMVKCFTDNSQVYLFLLSLVTVGYLFWGIRKRISNIELGIFLFITTGCYLDTMNGVRQYLVSAILFYFLPELLEKKRISMYILLIALMSTIHASALLFIPIYFVATKKPWSKVTWGIIVTCFIVYIYFNSGIGAVMAEFLEGTSYGEDYADMLLNGNTSVNVLRVFVAASPIVLAFINRIVEEETDITYNIAFNMSIINLMVWIFATKVLYFYRLAMYFTPYMILLLCMEVERVSGVKSRRLIKGMVYTGYFIFHMYSMYITGDTFFVGYFKV